MPSSPSNHVKNWFWLQRGNFKIFDKKNIFWSIVNFRFILQRERHLLSHKHVLLSSLYEIYFSLCWQNHPSPHATHQKLIPSSNPHTTTFRTRDSSNDSGNWCEHDSFWETRREIILFLCFSLLALHINFPSLIMLLTTRISLSFARLLVLIVTRLSESLKACARSLSWKWKSWSYFTFIVIVYQYFSPLWHCLQTKHFWDFHFHSLSFDFSRRNVALEIYKRLEIMS